MCSRRMAITSSRVKLPPVSQPGSWLCQTRVWPRTAMWFASANCTSASASVKLKVVRDGRRASILNAFSATSMLNSRLRVVR
jgi:hypothetical protein